MRVGPNSQTDPADSTLTYNTLAQLTGISTVHNGTSLENLAYTYDPLGRVQTFTSIDGTATYGYDPMSQVTSASYTTNSGGHQPANESFSFDTNGNRTVDNGMTATVSTGNHVTNDGTFAFVFDAQGNRVSRTRDSSATANDYLVTYTWDTRNRLTDVEDFNNSNTLTQHLHYVYDQFNQLIERDLDPTGGGAYTDVTHYVWDSPHAPGEGQGEGGVVLEFNGSGQPTARDLNGPNTNAYDQYFSNLGRENVTSLTSPGAVMFNLLDNESTLRDMVDSNGVVQDHVVYTVFGQEAYELNQSVSRLAGFAGGIYDPATGLINYVNRWYDPAAAVWISADPEGFSAGDTNLARYVVDDPANAYDPSGLEHIIITASHGGGDESKNDRGFGQPTRDMPDQGPLQKGVTGKFSRSGNTGSVTIYFKGDDTCNTISGRQGQAIPSLRDKSGTYSGGMLTAALLNYRSGTYKVVVRYGASLTSSCTSQPVRLQGLWMTTPDGAGGYTSRRLTGDPSPGATLNKPVEFSGTTTVIVKMGRDAYAPIIQLEPNAIRGRNDDPPEGSPAGTVGPCCTTVYSAYLQVLSVTRVTPSPARPPKPPASEPLPKPQTITPFGPFPAAPPGSPPGAQGA